MRRIVIAAAMSLCVVSVSSADTLIMRDGTRIPGTVMMFARRTVTFKHADGVVRQYPTSQVEGLELLSAERANPAATPRVRSLEAPAGPSSDAAARAVRPPIVDDSHATLRKRWM